MLLPTLLSIYGTVDNPWGPVPVAMAQAAWDVVYGSDGPHGPAIPHAIVEGDVYFKHVSAPSPFQGCSSIMSNRTQIMQRVYEWRTQIGYAGIEATGNWIKANGAKLQTTEKSRTFLAQLITSYQVLYEDPWSTQKKAG